MPATTFVMICECFRCAGFRSAFAPFSGINSGRCLRCNGGLRDVVTKPLARLEEYEPGAAKRRADSIATIAKVLGLIGREVTRDASGRMVSPWGFAYRLKGDDMAVFCAALTIAPPAVRTRGWAAFCAKVRATLEDGKGRAERVITKTRKLAAEYAGTGSEGVGEWLGEGSAVTAGAAQTAAA